MSDAADLHVVRDVLDKAVVDRDGRPMGRADSVTIVVPSDGPPRLESVVIGSMMLAHRAAPRLARWAVLERWLPVVSGPPVAVPFDRIECRGLGLKADVQAGETAAMNLEQRLQRWLARIPGSR